MRVGANCLAATSAWLLSSGIAAVVIVASCSKPGAPTGSSASGSGAGETEPGARAGEGFVVAEAEPVVAVGAGSGDVVQGLGGLGVKSRRHEEREAKTPW
jgi:hypothetical protein